MAKNDFKNETNVLKHQRDRICDVFDETNRQSSELDELEKQISKLEKFSINSLFSKKNKAYETKIDTSNITFEDLSKKAKSLGYNNVDIYDVATIEEINETNEMLRSYYKEFTKQYDLDAVDCTISGIIGTIAALIDFLLVTEVNGKNVTTGKLKTGVEDVFSKILPQNRIKSLEERFKVCYDISKNTSTLSQEVLGLCPLYHRFMSLGHDPLLGLIFGVKDLLSGSLTAIDGSGRLIIQNISKNGNKNIFEAIIYVFGHFLSDVSTPSKSGKILSVPAPLTPLLQLITHGSVEYKGDTLNISELSKKMFYDGYNFNHFVGMSVPVFLIEVLTRISFFIKENIYSKNNVKMKKNPKLDTMLFISNGILFAENAGKLVITQNPMSINYVSWIATANYGFKTLKWYSYDREIGKMKNAQKYIDSTWNELINDLDDSKPYLIK